MSALMFETSTSTAKLDAALAKAQGEIEAAEKSATNEAFKRGNKATRYADLAAVWSAIRPTLSKHGIAVTQWPAHSEDNRLHLITRLAHDGEWMRCELSIPVNKMDAHGYGSAMTYAKRYGLSAAVGVVADEDDDGNAATKAAPKNGNGKMDLAVKTPDERGPDTPFPEITGQTGRPKYKSEKNDAPAEYLFLQSTIRALRTENDLLDWIADETNKAAINKLPADWIPDFREEYKDRLAALRAAA